MADANRPLSQEEIDALLSALSAEAGDAPPAETSPAEPAPDDAASQPEAATTSQPKAPASHTAAEFLKDPRWARTAGLPVSLQVSLGDKHVPVKSLLNWGIGTQLVLAHEWHDPVTIKINGLDVGSGRVVLVGNNFGIEVTEWGKRNPVPE